MWEQTIFTLEPLQIPIVCLLTLLILFLCTLHAHTRPKATWRICNQFEMHVIGVSGTCTCWPVFILCSGLRRFVVPSDKMRCMSLREYSEQLVVRTDLRTVSTKLKTVVPVVRLLVFWFLGLYQVNLYIRRPPRQHGLQRNRISLFRWPAGTSSQREASLRLNQI